MSKDRIKYLLDFIPLIILTISALILIWVVSASDIALGWKHFVGLFLLPVNYGLFFWRHKIGVLFLGVTLILGLFSLLSYSPAISTYSIYKSIGSGNGSIQLFYGQPVFLLWILIHFIVSGRHYFGIVTKKYWHGLLNKQ